MTVISKGFAEELVSEKDMREAYLAAQTRTRIANQIRVIRQQRGWSQEEFAKAVEKPQSNVSRLESRDYGSFTLKTLLEIASTFDVGLIVEFVPYEDFLLRTNDLSQETLEVSEFDAQAVRALAENADPMIIMSHQRPPPVYVSYSQANLARTATTFLQASKEARASVNAPYPSLPTSPQPDSRVQALAVVVKSLNDPSEQNFCLHAMRGGIPLPDPEPVSQSQVRISPLRHTGSQLLGYEVGL